MSSDPLKHHYACLTPAERFALTIEAMARGDENEADRLEDACPTHSYHMHDPEYRLSIAWQNVAYNQPPHTSFFVGAGMANPPKPRITLVTPR